MRNTSRVYRAACGCRVAVYSPTNGSLRRECGAAIKLYWDAKTWPVPEEARRRGREYCTHVDLAVDSVLFQLREARGPVVEEPA
jgi:hypothetical protein